MHWMTAKLIALNRAETLLAHDLLKLSQLAFAAQVKALREELPADLLAAYERVRTEHNDPIVGVFQRTCGGCHWPLTAGLLASLDEEKQSCFCPHCGRFIYRAGGQNLVAHPRFHDSSQTEKP